MKIIIVGCGKVGQTIAETLGHEKEHDITVIDLRPETVRDIVNENDILAICGNGVDIDILQEAGIAEADILIAVTGDDETNLMTCLLAKKAGDCQTIARVKKPEFHKASRFLKEELGLAMIINPEQAAALEIARSLRFPSAIQIDTFAKGRVEILKFKVEESSPLDEMKIVDITQKLNCDILVCGVERGDEAFIPGGNFVLKKGDLVSIVSSFENGLHFIKKAGIKTNKVKDAIIVGGGATAYYLARLLLKTGVDVKIIEQNFQRCEELCAALPKATVIHGDGTKKNLLMEENIEHAGAFVSLTNIDEENILLSLFAKSMTSGKLVTKINRIAYDKVISNLDIGTTVYPKNITAEYIVRFVRAKKNSIGSNIETMHFILEGKVEALEFRIKEDSQITNMPLENMNLKKNILIAWINRNGNIIIPRGKDTIQKGDTVIVVTTNTGFKDISDILM